MSIEQRCLLNWMTLKDDPATLAEELTIWAATYMNTCEGYIQAKMSDLDGISYERDVDGLIHRLKGISPNVIHDLAQRGSLRKHDYYDYNQGANFANDQAASSNYKERPNVGIEPCRSDNEDRDSSFEDDEDPGHDDDERPEVNLEPRQSYMYNFQKQARAPLSTPARGDATGPGSTVMRRRVITPRSTNPQQLEAITNVIESLQDLTNRPPAARERIMSATGFTRFAEELKEKLTGDNEMEKLQAENVMYYAKILENDRKMDALGNSFSSA